MKRIIVIVALSVVLAPIFCSGTDYYVDSQAASSGDGTQASPFATIQEGIDVACAGDTIYLRGSLYVTNASQCVVIPADKPELTLAKWDADRFSIEVDNEFIKNMPNKASTNIITVCAQSNTISGIEFVYHKNSLGQQNYGKGSFVFFCTNYQTVVGCRFYRPPTSAEAPGYAGVDSLISGRQWGGGKDNAYGQDYITIRDCVFENTFGGRGDTHKYPNRRRGLRDNRELRVLQLLVYSHRHPEREIQPPHDCFQCADPCSDGRQQVAGANRRARRRVRVGLWRHGQR